ncbi:MAG: hypothetical protein ACRD3S_10390, partial [Terracidiphilus sp.]
MPRSGIAAAQSAQELPCGSAGSICHGIPSSRAAEIGSSAAITQASPHKPDGSGAHEEDGVIDAPEPHLDAASSPWELAARASLPAFTLQAVGTSGKQANGDGSSTGARAAEQQDQAASGKHPTGKHASSATSGSPGHIFWVIPAYKVNYSGQFKPLTPKEKFQEWAQSAYDPLGLATTAVEAGTLEHSSSDGFCGYGATFTDYMKCFGSLELDANDSSFLGDYVLTVWWHQDPRYFRLGKGSFGKRTLYAVSRVFITYNDSGKNVLYSSGLAGTGIAAVVSNLYYPQSDRTAGHTFSRVAIDLGDTALYNG